jgi:hypothetical protein
MRIIVVIIAILTSSCLCFGQTDTYNYGDTVTMQGQVTLVSYEMPTGDRYDTYILKLDETINVEANEEWEGHSNVKEIHLNIMNWEIENYVNQKIKLEGILFHALTVHHRRDVCIKVNAFEAPKPLD